MAGLANIVSNPFYGKRIDGTTKGLGFFGNIGNRENQITELSATVGPPNNQFLSPLINPLTTKEERQHLVNGGEPTQEMWNKAEKWGLFRQSQGRSPFLEDADLFRGLYKGK